VHGFQLGVPRAKALECPDGQQGAVGAAAEHGDGRIEQAGCVQGINVPGRLVRGGELQVALHHRANVAGSQVVDRDRDLRHRCRGRIRGGVQVRPLPVYGQPGGELDAPPGLVSGEASGLSCGHTWVSCAAVRAGRARRVTVLVWRMVTADRTKNLWHSPAGKLDSLPCCYR
jgi:hypothetical protein